MRRLECCACGRSIMERIRGRLLKRQCLYCKRGILLEPEDCHPDPEDDDGSVHEPVCVTKTTTVACWACNATAIEEKHGALVGAVRNRCGEGRLLACRA